jgi:hypothetical protein
MGQDYNLIAAYKNWVLSKQPFNSNFKTLSDCYEETKIPLHEGMLGYAEFQKPQTAKRPDRKELFLQKYKNGTAFDVKVKNQTKKVVFVVDPNVIKAIESLPVGFLTTADPNYKKAKKNYDTIRLTDKSKAEYSLNNLIKTPEFAGQGSGGGGTNTRINEASVCLWAAVYQFKRNASPQTVTKFANHSSVTQHCKVDIDIPTLINQTDKNWLVHYESTAKYLVENILPNSQSEYTFHRNSEFVKQSIYGKFSQLSKMTGGFNDSNKWNPADIWAISADYGESKFNADIQNIQTLQSYNALLVKLYKTKQLIGISLKKTAGGLVSAKEFNLSGSKQFTATVDKVTASGKTKGILAKDVYVTGQLIEQKNSTPYTLQFRSFTAWRDFQGEIKGTNANGGKVARSAINRILEKYKLELLPDYATVLSFIEKNPNKCLKNIYDMVKSLNIHQNLISWNTFANEYEVSKRNKSISEDFLFSKYFGAKLLTILTQTTDSIKNSIITDMFKYAYSSSDDSGPFVKLF